MDAAKAVVGAAKDTWNAMPYGHENTKQWAAYTNPNLEESQDPNLGTWTGNAGPVPGALHGYRQLAPGSEAIKARMRIPTEIEGHDIFDIGYYKKDTRRSKIHNQIKIITHPSLGIHEGDEPVAQIGAPGTFGNPAVKLYDETGLRSAMTATHEQYNESVSKYMPTQLPTVEWASEARHIVEDYKSKGLPPVPGKATGWKMPQTARTNQW
jgi:hypothetical protein